jgi:hypothetical protein
MMKKIKNIIQRNLDITKTYTIEGSYYVGLENGTCCDNCGRLIANVAEIRCNETNKRYTVGMDCAETLSGIKGNFDFNYIHKVRFDQARQARTKVKKMLDKIKEKGLTAIVKMDSHTDSKTGEKYGGYDIGCEPFNPNYRTWHYYDIEVWEKYIYPMIKEFKTV